jgi:hypothetical protein
MAVLLVIASAWPKFIVPVCIAMLAVPWVILRFARIREVLPEREPVQSRPGWRRAATIALALAVIIWALLRGMR